MSLVNRVVDSIPFLFDEHPDSSPTTPAPSRERTDVYTEADHYRKFTSYSLAVHTTTQFFDEPTLDVERDLYTELPRRETLHVHQGDAPARHGQLTWYFNYAAQSYRVGYFEPYRTTDRTSRNAFLHALQRTNLEAIAQSVTRHGLQGGSQIIKDFLVSLRLENKPPTQQIHELRSFLAHYTATTDEQALLLKKHDKYL